LRQFWILSLLVLDIDVIHDSPPDAKANITPKVEDIRLMRNLTLKIKVVDHPTNVKLGIATIVSFE
jgi:hypothetical protein